MFYYENGKPKTLCALGVPFSRLAAGIAGPGMDRHLIAVFGERRKLDLSIFTSVGFCSMSSARI